MFGRRAFPAFSRVCSGLGCVLRQYLLCSSFSGRDVLPQKLPRWYPGTKGSQRAGSLGHMLQHIKQPRPEIGSTSLRNRQCCFISPWPVLLGLPRRKGCWEKQDSVALGPCAYSQGGQTAPHFLEVITQTDLVILKPALNWKAVCAEHTSVQSGAFRKREVHAHKLKGPACAETQCGSRII